MKVLLVGSGGREHAIAHSLSKSSLVTKLYCAPGNAGIANLAECLPIAATDIEKLRDFAVENTIDFTVVGMDDPLVMGIVDHFEEKNLKVFGPRKNAAILEGSKVFSKDLMKKYNIPTAQYETFNDYNKAFEYIKICNYPVVIKADGLALGKGVIICEDIKMAEDAINQIMIDKKFGDSGNAVVVEEFLIGREVSLLAFCDGYTISPMVSSQDYKKALDGNKGLNTGGMGTISPSEIYTQEIHKECMEKIYIPTVRAMQAENRPFKGVLYFGLIFTKDGVKVLEYNARFGDPETQVILPKLKTDIMNIFMACVDGTLDKLNIEWEDSVACCVVLASGGYPGDYEKGYEITGIEDAENAGGFVFHAGTKLKDGKPITSGGRVLGVTALGKTKQEAIDNAYKLSAMVNFKDKHFRTDIGL